MRKHALLATVGDFPCVVESEEKPYSLDAKNFDEKYFVSGCNSVRD